MEQVYITLIVLAVVYVYARKWMAGKHFSKVHRVDGKTVIVTGGTTGIGKETVIGLAERGAKVIVACRDLQKGQNVCSKIISQTKNENVRAMQLNLASFKSIRAFVETFLKEETRLDILVNNASVMAVDRCYSEDGLEMHMAVNHFGHFLLTLLLIHRLKECIPSRIVTVSNLGHNFVRFNKNNLNSEISYNRFRAFFHSKLANVLFTKELAQRLSCSGITANSVHPGLFHVDTSRLSGSFIFGICRSICDLVSKIVLHTAKSGAQNTIFAAADFNLQNISGMYFDNFRHGRVNPDAENHELRSWLWEYSEKVTGIRFPTDDWKVDDSYKINKNKMKPFAIPKEIYKQSLI